MANLLSYLKEKGLSQLEAIELLSKIDTEPEVEEATEEPIEEEEPEERIPTLGEPAEEDQTEPEMEEEEPTIIQMTPEELATKIAEAVVESKKSKRAVPSKGKKVNSPMVIEPNTKLERPREWYERIV